MHLTFEIVIKFGLKDIELDHTLRQISIDPLSFRPEFQIMEVPPEITSLSMIRQIFA